jgi:hypothetical protein
VSRPHVRLGDPGNPVTTGRILQLRRSPAGWRPAGGGCRAGPTGRGDVGGGAREAECRGRQIGRDALSAWRRAGWGGGSAAMPSMMVRAAREPASAVHFGAAPSARSCAGAPTRPHPSPAGSAAAAKDAPRRAPRRCGHAGAVRRLASAAPAA